MQQLIQVEWEMTDAVEVLKTGAVDKAADLLHKLAGPAFEELGAIFGDKVRLYRAKNMVDTIKKTERLLHDAGLPVSAVPTRLLLPIFENCSIEDDASVQELWAGLLATASQKTNSVSPSFVETLKQLTPDEAKHLEVIYKDYVSHDPIGSSSSLSTSFGRADGIFEDVFERLGLIRREYEVTLRAGRLQHREDPHPNRMWVAAQSLVEKAIDSLEPEIGSTFVLTQYAINFLQACHGPRPLSHSVTS